MEDSSEVLRSAMMVTSSAPHRVRHVMAHYLPMIVLGIIFLVIGLAPSAPHIGLIPLGDLFLILGVIMLVGAVLGMLFTRCEKDYVTWRVMCFNEPDVFSDAGGGYYRELVPEESPFD
jgi:hypothetical protein